MFLISALWERVVRFMPSAASPLGKDCSGPIERASGVGPRTGPVAAEKREIAKVTFVLTNVTLASSCGMLPDDGDYTETC